MSLSNIEELKTKLQNAEGEPEERYFSLVLDEALRGIDDHERAQRKACIQQSGRTVNDYTADIETARKLWEALAHLDATDWPKVEQEAANARDALKRWTKEIKPSLESELQLMGAKITRHSNDADREKGKYLAAQGWKKEARIRNRTLADIIAKKHREQKGKEKGKRQK